jgi:hypothetical protein
VRMCLQVVKIDMGWHMAEVMRAEAASQGKIGVRKSHPQSKQRGSPLFTLALRYGDTCARVHNVQTAVVSCRPDEMWWERGSCWMWGWRVAKIHGSGKGKPHMRPRVWVYGVCVIWAGVVLVW